MRKVRFFPMTTDEPDRWAYLVRARELLEIRGKIDAVLDEYNKRRHMEHLRPLLDELRGRLLAAKYGTTEEQAG